MTPHPTPPPSADPTTDAAPDPNLLDARRGVLRWPPRITGVLLTVSGGGSAAVAGVAAAHGWYLIVVAAVAVCLIAAAAADVHSTVIDRYWRWQVHAARTDPLTDLPLRSVAETVLARPGPLTVALIDVGGLHAVNERFGFAAGDDYLRGIAARIRAIAPQSAIVARMGGDEFAVLAHPVDADWLAVRLGAVVTDALIVAGRRLQPRASIGVASHPDDGRLALGCADLAMLTARRRRDNLPLAYAPSRDGDAEPIPDRPVIRRRETFRQPPTRAAVTVRDEAAVFTPGAAPRSDTYAVSLWSAPELTLLSASVLAATPGTAHAAELRLRVLRQLTAGLAALDR